MVLSKQIFKRIRCERINSIVTYSHSWWLISKVTQLFISGCVSPVGVYHLKCFILQLSNKKVQLKMVYAVNVFCLRNRNVRFRLRFCYLVIHCGQQELRFLPSACWIIVTVLDFVSRLISSFWQNGYSNSKHLIFTERCLKARKVNIPFLHSFFLNKKFPRSFHQTSLILSSVRSHIHS